MALDIVHTAIGVLLFGFEALSPIEQPPSYRTRYSLVQRLFRAEGTPSTVDLQL